MSALPTIILPLLEADKKWLAVRALQIARKYDVGRGPCVKCGSNDRIHGHHPNYDKPLEIVWLCPRCHAQEHAGHDTPKPVSRQRRSQIRMRADGKCTACQKPNDRMPRCICSACVVKHRNRVRVRIGLDPEKMDRMHASVRVKHAACVARREERKKRLGEGSDAYRNLLAICDRQNITLSTVANEAGLSLQFHANLRRKGTASTSTLSAVAGVLRMPLGILLSELYTPKQEVAK